MKKITLFATSSAGKPKQWSIWTEPNGYVCKEWGYIDGAKQTTKDLVKQKNLGKSNETSLDEQAELEAQRILDKKREEGYSESLNTANNSEIDWVNAVLPDTFAPSKPETSIEPENEQALIDSGNALYQRKHNGQRAFVIKGRNNNVNIYSRRMELKTDLFPKHVELFAKILPNGTIVDCECVANDDPDLIKTIFGADKEKALERQKAQEVDFIIFDCLYRMEKEQCQNAYQDRYGLLQRLNPLILAEAINRVRKHISMVSIVENIDKSALQTSWEGLILRDKSAPMKIRWDGKPDRKSGSWKKKNFIECDVVAYKWTTGKGKNNDRPAKLFVGAYDNNKLVEISEVGSGLTEKDKDDILSGKIKLPIAIELKYEEVTPAKSFRLPIFLRFREDKPIKECLLKDIKGM